MWPFGGDKHELIDSGYLKKNGINEDYRDAFNMKNRKLKEEIKRNEKVKQSRTKLPILRPISDTDHEDQGTASQYRHS